MLIQVLRPKIIKANEVSLLNDKWILFVVQCLNFCYGWIEFRNGYVLRSVKEAKYRDCLQTHNEALKYN